MWVRDHQRPLFHEALGVDVTWYGQEVFRKTSEGTRQIFPFVLDIDHARWRPNLDRMERASRQVAAGKARGGIGGTWSSAPGQSCRAFGEFRGDSDFIVRHFESRRSLHHIGRLSQGSIEKIGQGHTDS